MVPKSSRNSPVAGAVPIAPASNPNEHAAMPLGMLLPDRTPTMDRPSAPSMNNSADENSRISGRATKTNAVSTSAPNKPPTNEEAKAALSARAASPRRANGKPSRIVAWEDADPGMAIRTDVKVSEVGTTASIPISMAKAAVGGTP